MSEGTEVPKTRRFRHSVPWLSSISRGAQWIVCARRRALGAGVSNRAADVPAGAHDDQVDALGLIGQLLDRMVLGQTPAVVKSQVSSGQRPRHVRGDNLP